MNPSDGRIRESIIRERRTSSHATDRMQIPLSGEIQLGLLKCLQPPVEGNHLLGGVGRCCLLGRGMMTSGQLRRGWGGFVWLIIRKWGRGGRGPCQQYFQILHIDVGINAADYVFQALPSTRRTSSHLLSVNSNLQFVQHSATPGYSNNSGALLNKNSFPLFTSSAPTLFALG